ncbi:MAG TPA: hypothetical protein VF691_01600 [Cytophagaceae bacterium]|jgi:hypothetical protein
MNKSHIEKEFLERFIVLRKIVNGWNLIPGYPKDGFDTLNHKILSHLYKGADFEKIKRVLESDLTVIYGLTLESSDIERLTQDIITWWDLN